MVNRDKTPSDQQLQALYRAFATQETNDQVRDLMFDLCTIREINEMAQRLTVAEMLHAGASYLSIQEHTGVSATTIARVSKCLSYGSGGYLSIVDLADADTIDPGANLSNSDNR